MRHSPALASPGAAPHRCPCCHHRTLEERGGYEICPVCFWEDDGQDSHDADTVRGGPNGSLSLTQARENYLRIGACEEGMLGHVRPPRDEESDLPPTRPRDEAWDLREALFWGFWRRLSDPLLEIMLLVNPGAWPEIVECCGMAIGDEATQRTEQFTLRWAVRVARWLRLGPESTKALLEYVPRSYPPSGTSYRRMGVEPGDTDQVRARKALRWAQDMLARCQKTTGAAPDLEAALAVLERWPVG
ncbi:MAG: hypothetical protein EOO75_12970 [Myxococcales bacterium]|nr:MAG: hypothetical protein EOO75_12970 [Myxococcales bacterium]